MKKIILIIITLLCICPAQICMAKTNQKINMGKEEYPTIPLFCQQDYDVPYGKYGTVSSHGCGITAISMVATYLLDEIQQPDKLAQEFGKWNTEHGSAYGIFEDTANKLGLGEVICTKNKNDIVAALNNNQPVISLQHGGIFTRNGHFIVLTKINKDETIMVNDPNGYNWEKMFVKYNEGFTIDEIDKNNYRYWIYPQKKL